MPDKELTKHEAQQVVPVEEVRDLIAGAVRDGIASGVSAALAPIANQLSELAASIAGTNQQVAAKLSGLSDELAGRESGWDEHERNAHAADPALAARQAQARREWEASTGRPYPGDRGDLNGA